MAACPQTTYSPALQLTVNTMYANALPMIRDAALSIRIPADLKAELQKRADADARSLASYVTLALQKHVDRTPEPKAKSRK